MTTDRSDLDARLAAATPEDTVRGLIYNALFEVVAERIGRDAAVALDPAGKGKRVEFFSYPVSEFLKIAYQGAERLAETLGGADAAFHAFGHRATANVFASLPGRTLVALAGSRGPRSLLAQTQNGYRATVSYGERRVEWLGERQARITFERDFLLPAFHCGVLRGAIEGVGARAERIDGRQTGPLRSEYDVVWAGA